MNDIPDHDRPRERLLTHGANALSNAELLAILLRTGTAEENVLHLAQRILSEYESLQRLAQTSLTELLQIRGLGAAKVAQIAAAVELGKRIMTQSPNQRPVIRRAADAAALMMDMATLQQEHVRVMLMDNHNHLIATTTIYIGTLNASVLRVSEIFREAVTRNSPALILVHNHPSGNPAPSPEDVELTRTIELAGHLLDIHLIDHLIIAQGGWTSLRETGLGFERPGRYQR